MSTFYDLEAVKQEYALSRSLGFIKTVIPGVRLFYAEEAVPFNPLLYPAGIAIICQGQKQGMFGNQKFTYDEQHFLIVSVSTPIVCKTIAGPNSPLFGLFIDIDLSSLQQVITEMRLSWSEQDVEFVGVAPARISTEMDNTITRLIKSLSNRVESRVLGEGLKQEVLYRALKSKHGYALYALTQSHSPQSKLNKVISYIKSDYKAQMTVEQLAELANMSLTSFHRNFKQLTGESPLQYVKKTKLSRARSLIVHDGLSINSAALEVGYNSPSHFSRDFKKFYKVPPNQARDSGYALIDIWSA